MFKKSVNVAFKVLFKRSNETRNLVYDVISETLFSVRFHSCKKQLRKKISKNNMSSSGYENKVYGSKKNFFEEDNDSDMDELSDLIGNLDPCCYEPEQDTSELSGSNSDTNEDESSENVSPNNVKINRAGHKDWCIFGCCKK